MAPGLKVADAAPAATSSCSRRATGQVVVDSGAAAHSDALLAALRRPARRSDGKVAALINTHWHRDQTGANEALGTAGATIIAHDKTRQRLRAGWYVPDADRYEPPLPAAALPTKTFYTTDETIVGDQRIEFGYLIEAHTDGDAYVRFPDRERRRGRRRDLAAARSRARLVRRRLARRPRRRAREAARARRRAHALRAELRARRRPRRGASRARPHASDLRPHGRERAARPNARDDMLKAGLLDGVAAHVRGSGQVPLRRAQGLLGASQQAHERHRMNKLLRREQAVPLVGSRPSALLPAVRRSPRARSPTRSRTAAATPRSSSSQQGADVNAAQGDGTTPLHWAAYQLDAGLVRRLLSQRGASANTQNRYGASPLGEAVKAANAEIVELLLAAGADVEAPNADGETALMLAARTGSSDVASAAARAPAPTSTRARRGAIRRR